MSSLWGRTIMVLQIDKYMAYARALSSRTVRIRGHLAIAFYSVAYLVLVDEAVGKISHTRERDNILVTRPALNLELLTLAKR